MWSNWSGNQQCSAPVLQPKGAAEIAAAIRSADCVRPVGTGHSFTPLVPGAGAVIAPQPDGDPVRVVEGSRVWLDANAPLHVLSEALAAKGLAFRNLGDINVQTLAGASSTATHGTGATLPCLAAEITGARLVDGTGEVQDVSAEDLPGVQVALGLLGVLTEVEMEVVPAYNLRRRTAIKPAEELIGQMEDRWASHRNYEFFLLPHAGRGVGISHDVTEDVPGKPPMDLDELGVAYLKATRHLKAWPGLRRGAIGLLAAVMSDEDYVGESWKVLSSTRRTRFNEMEYHLPPEVARDVLDEIEGLLARKHRDVWFPIEVRRTAGDTAWLSPFQGGGRVSVAVHMAAGQDYVAYFRDCEAVFRAAGGRPHWGKLHGLKRANLEALYPDLGKFDALRARFDPKDRFMSPALAELFAR
ncbi:MAG: D-arabinono-1,4-lactone oxidase [Paracoccaceae bacterium]